MKPYEKPYGTLEIAQHTNLPSCSVMDDCVDNTDTSVDNLQTDKPAEPEHLQTQEEMLKAHRKARRVVKPPRRYGFDPEPPRVKITSNKNIL